MDVASPVPKGDEVMPKEEVPKITKEQKEIIVGILLGDAHLETANGRTYRLKIEHSVKQRDYVWHLYEKLKTLAAAPPKERVRYYNGRAYKKVWFNTKYTGRLRFFAHQFYRDGKKRVPKLIHRWLTPRAMAYWFMDDGSIKSHQTLGLILNTQSFSRKDVERLVKVLRERYGISCKERKQREGYQIYISSDSYETFRKLIEPYIIPSMTYKLKPREVKRIKNQGAGNGNA